MTQEQLIINMTKPASNYNNLVRENAYIRCIRYNRWVKQVQQTLKEIREYHKLCPDKITHPKGATYFDRKTGKTKYYTIYSKAPKMITFRQAFAIEHKELEVLLRNILRVKDERRQINKKYICEIYEEFPNE